MYFLWTVLTVALNIDPSSFGWREAVASFLFWPATDKITLPALEGGWSLCFEMLFYVCTALVLVNRRWAFVIIGAYGTTLMLHPIFPILQFLGNPIILEFLFGIAIAYAPQWRPGIWAIPLGVACLAGAGLMGISPDNNVMDLLLGHDSIQRVLFFGIPSAMIVFGSLQINARQSVWTYLGDASYTLYLSHPLVMLLLLAFWKKFPLPPDLGILVCICISLLLAWQIYERIEKPILTFLKKTPRLMHKSVSL